jgi:hypothetical protein
MSETNDLHGLRLPAGWDTELEMDIIPFTKIKIDQASSKLLWKRNTVCIKGTWIGFPEKKIKCQAVFNVRHDNASQDNEDFYFDGYLRREGNRFEFRMKGDKLPVLNVVDHALVRKGHVDVKLLPDFPFCLGDFVEGLLTFDNPLSVLQNTPKGLIGQHVAFKLQSNDVIKEIIAAGGVCNVVIYESDQGESRERKAAKRLKMSKEDNQKLEEELTFNKDFQAANSIQLGSKQLFSPELYQSHVDYCLLYANQELGDQLEFRYSIELSWDGQVFHRVVSEQFLANVPKPRLTDFKLYLSRKDKGDEEFLFRLPSTQSQPTCTMVQPLSQLRARGKIEGFADHLEVPLDLSLHLVSRAGNKELDVADGLLVHGSFDVSVIEFNGIRSTDTEELISFFRSTSTRKKLFASLRLSDKVLGWANIPIWRMMQYDSKVFRRYSRKGQGDRVCSKKDDALYKELETDLVNLGLL